MVAATSPLHIVFDVGTGSLMGGQLDSFAKSVSRLVCVVVAFTVILPACVGSELLFAADSFTPVSSFGPASGIDFSSDGKYIGLERRRLENRGDQKIVVDSLDLVEVNGYKTLRSADLGRRRYEGGRTGLALVSNPRLVRFSKDCKTIFVFDGISTLYVLSLPRLQISKKIELPFFLGPITAPVVTAMEVSADGAYAWLAVRRQGVRRYQIESGTYDEIWNLRGSDYASVALNPEAGAFAASNDRNTNNGKKIIVYDTKTTTQKTIDAKYPIVRIVLAEGNLVCAASAGSPGWLFNKFGVINCWSVETGKVAKVFQDQAGPRYSLAVSGNGLILLGYVAKLKWIVDGGVELEEAHFTLWNVGNGQVIGISQDLASHKGQFISAPVFRMNFDGTLVAQYDSEGSREAVLFKAN